MQSTLTAPEANSTALKSDERAGKYLTFMIGKEEFGVGVLKVREIMGIQEITAVPQTPLYLKGVMNLRGKAIPVIDLRLRLGFPESLQEAESSRHTPNSDSSLAPTRLPSYHSPRTTLLLGVNLMGLESRHYFRDGSYTNSFSGWGLDFTPIVKKLIIANVIVFLLQIFFTRAAPET